jgi:transposase-like protein
MRRKSSSPKKPAEQVVKDIRGATRRHFSAEDKIRIVLDGLRGDDSIAELCRREGIAQSLYYVWSKEFLEAGKRRLAGDAARAATTDEVKDLRREAGALKECVADLTLENRLLKKHDCEWGGRRMRLFLFRRFQRRPSTERLSAARQPQSRPRPKRSRSRRSGPRPVRR